MIDPSEDGISHINVYSKGKTELGRYLTNFGECYVDTDHGNFRTVEGYWYWLACHDDRLRHTDGWESKKLGRELRVPDWPKLDNFERYIMQAIMNKMVRPWCTEELIKTGKLPFYHYYVYNGRVIMPKDGLWMINLMTEFRDELVKNEKAKKD